eukprot:scaffold74123_cov36-Cyclotella_meneghiniana.AAC.1
MDLKNNIHSKQSDNEAVHESDSNVAVLPSVASNQAQMLLKRSKSQTSETANVQQQSSTNVATTNDSVFHQQAALMFDRSTAHITDVQSFVERTYVANAESPTNPRVVVGGIPIGEGPLSSFMDECNKHCTSVADDPALRPPVWKEDLVNVRNSWLREKRKVTDFYSDDNYDKKGRLKGGNVKHISEHLTAPTKDELMALVTYSIQAYGFDIDLAEKPFTNFDGDEHLQTFRPIPECTKACDQIIKAVQFIKFPPSVGFYHLGIKYLKTYHRAFRALYIFQLLSTYNIPPKDKLHYDIQYMNLYPNRLEDLNFKNSFHAKQHYLKVALQFHKNDQRLICQLMPSYLSIDDWDAVKKSLLLNDLCDIYDYTAVEDVDYPKFDPDAASQKMPSKQTTPKSVATPPKANGTMSEMSTPGTEDVLKEAKTKSRKKKADDTTEDKYISKKSKVDTDKPLSSDDEDDLPIKPTASKKKVVTFPRLTEGKTKEERCELSVTYSSPGVDDVVRVADKDCSLKSVRNFLQTKGKYKSYAKKDEIPQHLKHINNFKGIEGVDPRRHSYWPTNLLKMYTFANYGNIPAAVNDPLVRKCKKVYVIFMDKPQDANGRCTEHKAGCGVDVNDGCLCKVDATECQLIKGMVWQ